MTAESREARRMERMERRARRNRRRQRDDPWTRLAFGLSLLAAGSIAWLDHIGRINGRDFLRWWPLALIAVGIAQAANRRWIGVAIYVGAGLAFMPALPFLRHVRPGLILGLWPLLITAAGISLVTQTLRPRAKDSAGRGAFHTFAWMGGTSTGITAEQFVGGDAIVVMGACEVHLESAAIEQEAVIDVLAFWGGIDLRVPRDWVIENRITALFGGVADHTSNPATGPGPRLILRGSVIMSGIEIRNPKERAA